MSNIFNNINWVLVACTALRNSSCLRSWLLWVSIYAPHMILHRSGLKLQIWLLILREGAWPSPRRFAQVNLSAMVQRRTTQNGLYKLCLQSQNLINSRCLFGVHHNRGSSIRPSTSLEIINWVLKALCVNQTLAQRNDIFRPRTGYANSSLTFAARPKRAKRFSKPWTLVSALVPTTRTGPSGCYAEKPPR